MTFNTITSSKFGNLKISKEMFEKTDRFLLLILWFQLPVVSFIATYSYGTWREGLIASVFICAIGTLSYTISKGTLAHRILMGLLLLSYSVVLIAIQYGKIEMHFHVFISLPFLILYKDWRVIPPAALFIAFHHVIFNYCQKNNLDLFGFPLIVFNYGNGWSIVILHAIFVVVESGILIYYSNLFRNQQLEITSTNHNLENIVSKRTENLKLISENLEGKLIELKESENKIKTIVNNTMLGIFQVDLNGDFTYINSVMGQYLDMDIEEINLKGWHSVVNDEARGKVKIIWENVLENQSKFDEEVKFCINKRSGDYRWAKIKTTPIKNNENNISGHLGTFEEITDEKEKSKLIESQRTKIVESSRLSSLGEMAGGIAHEINNPITVISSNLRVVKKLMMKKNLADDEIFDYLNESEQTVQRISKIIQGLRTISRDASSDDFEKVHFKEILNDVLVLCHEKFKKRRISIYFDENDPNLNIEIECKRIQLSQVFVNLFNNSYDAIHDLDDKWIKIEVNNKDRDIEVVFSDSGTGIPKDVQDKMFQPFYTTKEIGKGTGIGLSLSLSIVKRHNGSFIINTDSPYTQFIITLRKAQEEYENTGS